MDLDYLKSNLGTLDYLVRKGLRSFIGKGFKDLIQSLPIKDLYKVDTFDNEKFSNLNIFRFSLVDNLLDIIIYTDKESEDIIRLETCYQNSDNSFVYNAA